MSFRNSIKSTEKCLPLKVRLEEASLKVLGMTITETHGLFVEYIALFLFGCCLLHSVQGDAHLAEFNCTEPPEGTWNVEHYVQIAPGNYSHRFHSILTMHKAFGNAFVGTSFAFKCKIPIVSMNRDHKYDRFTPRWIYDVLIWCYLWSG